MAAAVFHLSMRGVVFFLTVAIATLPTPADQKPCDPETTCRPGEETLIVNTTVAPSPNHGAKETTYSTYETDVTNFTPTKGLDDEMETETSVHPQSGHGQTTPVAVASPSPDCPTPSPDDANVAFFRTLSSEAKRRRLMQIAKYGTVEEMEAMLAAGADVAARQGESRWTALHWAAAARGHVDMARRLIGCGAEVDAAAEWQLTPLHWVAMNGRAALVGPLVASSANPNVRDAFGRTPLHWAAWHGKAAATAALLEAGADKDVRDHQGKTPLDLARQHNNQYLISLLL